MTIQLPYIGRNARTELTLTSNAWNLTSSFGGPDQRIGRMGDRWNVRVNCRGMSQEQGSAYAALVSQGLHEKIRQRVDQPGVTPPANMTVTSGSGRTLGVSGSGAKAGQLFTLIHGGIHYLHRVVSVSGSTLTIQPALKVVPTSGDVVSFSEPQIEGFIAEGSVTVGYGLTGVMTLSYMVRESQ